MEKMKKYQYWLRSVSELTNKNRKKLIEYCGSAKEVYALTKNQLEKVYGITEEQAQAVVSSRKSWDLDGELERLAGKHISMLTMEESGYPERLRCLSDCPYALFYRGSLPGDAERTAAIVGARGCSQYGRAAGLALGELLGASGVGVVSGMAAGVDSFGHWGAIKGGGKTYAVLGCGVDVCYPKGARELYGRISEDGGVISEYLPGTSPRPQQFPSRNRLISAFSDIVIVVEAKKRSGSLITADFALEQGKEIYAVPGRLDDGLSRGCNELIRQGAGIIVSPEDLLSELGLPIGKKIQAEEKTKNLLEKEESLVYSCFDLHTKNMEELVQMTGVGVPEMADILVSLQAKGLVREHFKNHYGKT